MTDLASTIESLLDEPRPLRSVVPAPARPVVAQKAPVGLETGIDPILAFECALGMLKPDELASKHGVPIEVLTEMLANPHFVKLVDDFKTDLETHGVSFRLKAAVQAEIYMDSTLWEMANDPTTPSQVKLDYFKALTKVAGLEPKPNAGGEGGPGFRLVINLGNDAPAGRLIEATAE